MSGDGADRLDDRRSDGRRLNGKVVLITGGVRASGRRRPAPSPPRARPASTPDEATAAAALTELQRGLGLPIARDIVEAHGGELVLSVDDGVDGACFVVRMPLT